VVLDRDDPRDGDIGPCVAKEPPSGEWPRFHPEDARDAEDAEEDDDHPPMPGGQPAG
jgi:hypothetical protein